ncbi:Hypothetical protein A7982_05126 [Minicystis rosea]|nr:Hypothetical protein A7982_05126 [Minicystis rosea]
MLTTSSTGGPCETRCSADLHSLVDCRDKVISTCPADQGCSKSGCIPACDSARENKNTIGCDYYVLQPDVISAARGGCFVAYVANTWTAPVTLQIEYGNQALDAAKVTYLAHGSGKSLTYDPLPDGAIPAGEVGLVFLSSAGNFAACPAGVNVALSGDAALHGSGIGSAFHIATSAPTVAYDIYPYGGGQTAATSATLLLPTTAWDTNYIAVDAYPKSTFLPEGQPWLAIVASEDDTTVTLSPTPIGPDAGAPKTYALKKGQALQFTQDTELTGNPIQADKPVGVWGGATCLTIAVDALACDSAHQQIPPVKALGSEYVAVRHRDRFDGKAESPPWRLVGAVDGTKLTYDPEAPEGAPSSLATGQVAIFRAGSPFVVRSQDSDHPFYLSGHMTGWSEADPSGNDKRGDPEFVNVIPPRQYLSSYVFFTDPTYPETNLVVVRRNDGFGFQDVNLDCAGKLGGWQKVGTGGSYEYTRIDLVRHDFQSQNGCDNGRHEMRSSAPFGLTIWGWGSVESGGPPDGFSSQAVSYAYPAGASLQPINVVEVLPIPK